jgi:hypothetical protein
MKLFDTNVKRANIAFIYFFILIAVLVYFFNSLTCTLKNRLIEWLILIAGYKSGGRLVTSACFWSQKICTVTRFQKFALKTGLYKSNCQCKVNINSRQHWIIHPANYDFES